MTAGGWLMVDRFKIMTGFVGVSMLKFALCFPAKATVRCERTRLTEEVFRLSPPPGPLKRRYVSTPVGPKSPSLSLRPARKVWKGERKGTFLKTSLTLIWIMNNIQNRCDEAALKSTKAAEFRWIGARFSGRVASFNYAALICC